MDVLSVRELFLGESVFFLSVSTILELIMIGKIIFFEHNVNCKLESLAPYL